MKRLAIIFPGIIYNADRPLLYYSRKIAERSGYETEIVRYSGFPKKEKGVTKIMPETFMTGLAQAKEFLAGLSLAPYEDILFIGKSIGTMIAAELAARSPVRDKVRIIAYTPVEKTFSNPLRDAVVFTGSGDPWVGGEASPVPAICAAQDIPCFVIPDANHALETDDPLTDVRNLQEIMERTAAFIRKEPLRS